MLDHVLGLPGEIPGMEDVWRFVDAHGRKSVTVTLLGLGYGCSGALI
jgi:hypothetical protein